MWALVAATDLILPPNPDVIPSNSALVPRIGRVLPQMRDRRNLAPISPPEAGYPYPSVKHGPSWKKVRLSNPWLEPHHYTAAIDWMLEVVDGIEEGALLAASVSSASRRTTCSGATPPQMKIARRGRSVP